MQKARVHQVAKRFDKPRETEDWPRVATTVASRDVSSALECEKMP